MLAPLARRSVNTVSSNMSFSFQRKKDLAFWGPFFVCLIAVSLLFFTFETFDAEDEAITNNPHNLVLLGPNKDMFVVRLSALVADALRTGKPVVALESTVVTHGGLGYPRNLETAKALENEIRTLGAIPATIAIFGGAIRIGLTNDELEFLAKADNAVKCSKRDLGSAIALKWTGSTTVAATMFSAHLAGIQVFATGGLGGVHRGAFGGSSATLDVSADLTELSRTPVTVVCAGVKSILDVPGTLEWLETQGVPVAVLESKYFPQFFSNSNDEKTRLPAPLVVNNVQEVSRIMLANNMIKTGTGMVLAVPNPNPVPGIEAIVQQALQESSSVKGKDITPFVLRKVAELTNGKSILSNIELLKNNARIGASLAVEFARLKASKEMSS